MSEAEGGFVLGPGGGRLIDVGGFGVTVKAGRHETGGAFTLIETSEAVLGVGPPLHVHRDAAESFYVIEGEYLMHLDVATSPAQRVPSSTSRAASPTRSRSRWPAVGS